MCIRDRPDEADARAFFARRDFRGVNVTIPYKKLALEACDEVDPSAAAIGAVNTVVNRGGRLVGYNTDYDGFAYTARRRGISFRDLSLIHICPLADLVPGGGRPLSQTREALAAQYAARLPLYQAACHARVENTGDFYAVAKAIEEAFYEVLRSERA